MNGTYPMRICDMVGGMKNTDLTKTNHRTYRCSMSEDMDDSRRHLGVSHHDAAWEHVGDGAWNGQQITVYVCADDDNDGTDNPVSVVLILSPDGTPIRTKTERYTCSEGGRRPIEIDAASSHAAALIYAAMTDPESTSALTVDVSQTIRIAVAS